MSLHFFSSLSKQLLLWYLFLSSSHKVYDLLVAFVANNAAIGIIFDLNKNRFFAAAADRVFKGFWVIKDCTGKVNADDLRWLYSSNPKHLLDDFNFLKKLFCHCGIMLNEWIGWMKKSQIAFGCYRTSKKWKVLIFVIKF